MKKAGRKKPGPKKGWKLKGTRKAANQQRASGLRRAAKRTVRKPAKKDAWSQWYRTAKARGGSLVIEIGRGRALRITTVKVS